MSRNCLLHQTTNPDAQVAQMMLERVGGQLGVSKDDLGRFEGPQIVHYDPGGEYRWHLDAYEEGTEEGDRAVADQGQRCQVGCRESNPSVPRSLDEANAHSELTIFPS